MNRKNEIIKTKAYKNSKWHRALGAREIAQKIWGELKVTDSFLYLYRRFGTPSYDTNDEYKITYDYRFWYQGLYFCICGTTPDFVYLDCYFSNKFFLLQRNRYREDVRSVFEKALRENVLCWPWACGFSQISDSLTKSQLKAYNAKFDEEARMFFNEEDYNWLNSKQKEELNDEDATKCMNLMDGFYKHLQGKFKKWAGNDRTIKTLFWSNPDLRYLPEVERIVKDFCREMLKPIPIRDCDINIKGWR